MKKDERKLNLEDITPEYYSRNILIKNLFWSRLDTAIEVSELNRDMRVLDLGVGPGHLLELLLEKYPKLDLHGTDFNQNLKDIRLKNVKLVLCDNGRLPFMNGRFDLIFCLDVLEHIYEMDNAIKEIGRVLKPSGLVIISLPTENMLYKLGRLVTKGTTSTVEGPGTGQHYHKAGEVKKSTLRYFVLEKKEHLPFRKPFNLFEIMLYKKKK